MINIMGIILIIIGIGLLIYAFYYEKKERLYEKYQNIKKHKPQETKEKDLYIELSKNNNTEKQKIEEDENEKIEERHQKAQDIENTALLEENNIEQTEILKEHTALEETEILKE